MLSRIKRVVRFCLRGSSENDQHLHAMRHELEQSAT